MSSGTQVDLDWAGPDAAQGGADASPAGAQETGAVGGAYLTDEEILGMELSPLAPTNSGGLAHRGSDSGVRNSAQQGGAAEAGGSAEAAAAKTTRLKRVPLGRCLRGWRHWRRIRSTGARRRRFGASIRSFARRLLLRRRRARSRNCCLAACADVLTLREATQSVERIDAALFSGDARAQSEVVAEIGAGESGGVSVDVCGGGARCSRGWGRSECRRQGAAAGHTLLRRRRMWHPIRTPRLQTAGKMPAPTSDGVPPRQDAGHRITDHETRATASPVAALRSCCLRDFRAVHQRRGGAGRARVDRRDAGARDAGGRGRRRGAADRRRHL